MARVQLLFTPGCAGCGQTKSLIARLAESIPNLDWEEIDLIERPELALRYGIMSVPAISIDGKLEFTGVPKERALRDKLASAAEKEG
jgi:thioredoxin 1